MSCKFILSKRIRHVFHITLLDSTVATMKGHWFIINHHDDNNTNTLASFLGLCYADMVDLFVKAGLMSKQRIQLTKMSSFIDDISPDKKLMELSYCKFLLGGQKQHDYYLIQIGKFADGVSFSYLEQLSQKSTGMSPLSDNAKKLKELVKELSREAVNKEIILPVVDEEEGVAESSAGIPNNDNTACTLPSLESFRMTLME